MCKSFYPFECSSEVPRAPISNCKIIRHIVKWPPSFSLSRIQMLNNATCMKHGPPGAVRKNWNSPLYSAFSLQETADSAKYEHMLRTRTGMQDARLIFSCKRFSYIENVLYSGARTAGTHRQKAAMVWRGHSQCATNRVENALQSFSLATNAFDRPLPYNQWRSWLPIIVFCTKNVGYFLVVQYSTIAIEGGQHWRKTVLWRWRAPLGLL